MVCCRNDPGPWLRYYLRRAEAGTYKSYLALDLALTLANDHGTWLDGREISRNGDNVLYVASEGYDTLISSINAWKDGRNVAKIQQ